jgi:hypothetical protein
MQTLIKLYFKVSKVLNGFKFKSHYMFRAISPLSGVKVYLIRKPLLFVVAAIACEDPSDEHVCSS